MADRTFLIVGADADEKHGVRFWGVRWLGHPIERTGREFVTSEELGDHMGFYSDETYRSRIAPRRGDYWTMDEILELPTYRPEDPGTSDESTMIGDDVGARVVAALGEGGARELLEVLERSDADRAALIGRLFVREDAQWLAELLMDMEDEVGEIARLRLVDAIRREVREP
jgi:hypothetical protein